MVSCSIFTHQMQTFLLFELLIVVLVIVLKRVVTRPHTIIGCEHLGRERIVTHRDLVMLMLYINKVIRDMVRFSCVVNWFFNHNRVMMFDNLSKVFKVSCWGGSVVLEFVVVFGGRGLMINGKFSVEKWRGIVTIFGKDSVVGGIIVVVHLK